MKIYVNRKPGTLLCEVFIIDGEKSRYSSYLKVEENGTMTATTFERNGAIDNVKPAFVMDEMYLRDFLSAFIEHAREEGFKTPDESYTKGKLEATEAHLKDTRTLLKLK